MARRKKPGAPGKTKIPLDVVRTVSKRLKKAYSNEPDGGHSALVLTAQQHFLYLETVEKPRQILPGLVEARFLNRGGVRRTPLGRMVWTGDPDTWRLQLYKWSDECWDEENDAWTNGGTPEECIVQAIRGWGD